jgi:hypothetical protein
MKTFIAVAVVVALQGVAVACEKGCDPYEGVCACSGQTNDGDPVTILTSNELPSKHPESAWERGDVHADMPLPETAESEKDKMVAYEAKAEKDQK